MAKPVWTAAKIVDQLDTGHHWSGSSLSYAFPTNTSWLPSSAPETAGFSTLSSEQRAAATSALAAWDSLIAPNFSLTTNAAAAKIKFGNSPEAGFAYAYLPSNTYANAGSVWFNPEYDASWGWNDLVTPTVGEWGYATYIHELGHALGLEHPGHYNGGAPTYAKDALFKQDSVQYTMMSYFKGQNTGADWVASDGQEYTAQTPMLYDILTIQQIYGADQTTRAANTTYGYNSTAGSFVYDFAQNLHPIICIYDANGTDTLDVSASIYSCTLDLTPGSFSNTDMMVSNISIAFGTWIENAVGGTKADTITGNSLNNVLSGMAGNDTLNGDGGNDTLDGGTGADAMKGGIGDDTYFVDNAGDVITEASKAGTDTVNAAINAYALSANVENLTFTGTGDFVGTGSAVANIITGGSGNDTLDGGAGADWLIGGAGNDTYIVDIASDVVIEAASGGTDTVKTSASYTLSAEIENLTYTGTAAFTGTGNAADNIITGGKGNDTLNGGAGADIMVGGAGNDVYIVDDAGDVVTEAANSGTDTVQTTLSTYTMGMDLENLTFTGSVAATFTGNGLNNVIAGGVGNDVLNGGLGADTLSGGAGNDIYVVDSAKDVVKENVGAGLDTVQTTLTAYTLGADVENLTYTGSAAFTGTGNALNNTITSGNGDDILNGGAGADSLIGGAGNDTYIVDNIGDVVTDTAGAGADTVKTTLSAYTLGTDVEFLTFTGRGAFTGVGNGLDNVINGGTLADTLYGNGGNDQLNGGTGNDTLVGGTGADLMLGGTGNDTYVVDDAGDVVTEASNAGTDLVLTTLSSLTLGANVENLAFTGAGAFTGTGNAANNVITGGASGDTLDGGAGNDTLIGGNGDDTLIGGAGVDILTGGIGADIFRFFTASDSKGKTRDTIADFSSAHLDKIDLSSFDADTKLTGFQSFIFINSASFTGVAGQLSFSNGFLRADLNGDKASDFDVVLTGVSSLTINDFWL